MADSDHLYRFVFEHAGVRGEIVQLDKAFREVVRRRVYPPALRELVGQGLAAAALLASTLKFTGSLSLQIQSRGALRLFVVQVTSDRTVRALARWDETADVDGDLSELCPGGNLVITIDPNDGGERYQGIVSLDAGSLAGALDTYFRESEQLPTRVWLATGDERSAGLLVQRLPGEDDDTDAWNRAEQLAATISSRELLELSAPQIIRRLFHEEDIRLFDPDPFRFRCTCSRDRIAGMLRGLGYEEAREILDEQGSIEVRCEFCNEAYRFDAVDTEQVFAAAASPWVPSTRH